MFHKPEQTPIGFELRLRQEVYDGELISYLVVEAMKNMMYMRNHIQMPMRDLIDRDMSSFKSRERVKHDSFLCIFRSVCNEIEAICRTSKVNNAYFIAGANATFPIEGASFTFLLVQTYCLHNISINIVFKLAFNFLPQSHHISESKDHCLAARALIRVQIEALSLV
jgi:hypothetical protein